MSKKEYTAPMMEVLRIGSTAILSASDFSSEIKLGESSNWENLSEDEKPEVTEGNIFGD